MKKHKKISFLIKSFCLVLISFLGLSFCYAQSEKTSAQKEMIITLANKADFIAEGKIISTECFIDSSGVIYTSAIVKLSKIFKGNASGTEIEIVSRGGKYGDSYQLNDHGFVSTKESDGIFFLNENKTGISLNKKGVSYFPSYGNKSQIKYYHDNVNPPAGCFDVSYYNIEKEVYEQIEATTKIPRTVIAKD